MNDAHAADAETSSIMFFQKARSQMPTGGRDLPLGVESFRSKWMLSILSLSLSWVALSGRPAPIGAGRAVVERRKVGEVFVVGPFSPGQGRRLVHSDAITGGFMWNPAQAGEVFVTLADMLINGEEITDGMDIPGLGVISPDAETSNIIVDQLVALNKETVDELAKLGL